MYIRKNLSVIDVWYSDFFELIFLFVQLPMAHRMRICSLYHLPKFRYQEYEPMNCLENLIDDALDKSPNTLIVCGGDLNQLDLKQLQHLTDLSVLVNFSTRSDTFLDNCLKNWPDFSENSVQSVCPLKRTIQASLFLLERNLNRFDKKCNSLQRTKKIGFLSFKTINCITDLRY